MPPISKTYAQVAITNLENDSRIEYLKKENQRLLEELEKRQNNKVTDNQRYCAICRENVPDSKSIIIFGCCKKSICCTCSMNHYYQCTADSANTCPLCRQNNDYGDTHFEKSRRNNENLEKGLNQLIKISETLQTVYNGVKTVYDSDNIVVN